MKRTDYTAEAVEAAKRVLLEVTHLLGEYRDGIVLVGGWVPGLLLEGASEDHVGSMDVDLALDHEVLREPGYKTIKKLLLSRGYEQAEQPFIFFRTVQVNHREYKVELDLLAGEYAGTARKHRTQTVQDTQPRKARGCDLAIKLAQEVTIRGRLPDGANDVNVIRVAAIVPFIVMKAMALAGRLNAKDSYDIYYCVRNYPGGTDGLAEEFCPHMAHGLVREAIKILKEKFTSPDHVGPKQVAAFNGGSDPDMVAFLQRDSFERMSALLERLEQELPQR